MTAFPSPPESALHTVHAFRTAARLQPSWRNKPASGLYSAVNPVIRRSQKEIAEPLLCLFVLGATVVEAEAAVMGGPGARR